MGKSARASLGRGHCQGHWNAPASEAYGCAFGGSARGPRGAGRRHPGVHGGDGGGVQSCDLGMAAASR
jgi:hypothetical protein